MTRVFVVGMVWLLLAEVVAGGGFLLGYLVAGGVIPGLMIALACVVFLLLLPLAGDLVVEFDSQPKEAKVTLSWWGRVQVFLGEEKEVRVRFLGIPYRKRLKKKPPKAEPEAKPDMARWVKDNLQNVIRLALAGLQGANELAWQSKAITVTVNAPAETDVVDQIIAGLVGHRVLRLLDVKVLPEGPRRIRFLYRIALRDAAAAGTFVLVQGRVLHLARSLRRARQQAEATQRGR